ncbi:MAG: acetate--CoA ligase [Gemmatimonadetes bacterium]|nr:acetate--CoA ligase [Gemmatimonadota bacterium]
MSKKPHVPISDLLREHRYFAPPKDFVSMARVVDESLYEKADADPLAFWAEMAQELEWIAPWTDVLRWNTPDAEWFVDGKINASANCLDRHVASGLRNRAAIIWEGEPGDERTLTYWDMLREVSKFANGLKSLGVRKGDRVAIYMPMVPELPIAMLACARIGAIHSVIFAGFSADSLVDRISDAKAKAIITADAGWRRGNKLPLKAIVDDALDNPDTNSVEHVVVYQRDTTPLGDLAWNSDRDVWWHDLVANMSFHCRPEPTNAEDVLFILYTSGTTGKPKGIVHTTGGYMVGTYATAKYVFDLRDDDVFWCTADCGWVTGHSYIVYGPMANGVTQIMYEGAPDWPKRDRFWRIIEKYGVSIFYTAPTAIRAFMKWGNEWPDARDLSSLRLLGSVGEPINPEAWVWYHEVIGGRSSPIVDTWWQTETGAIMITPLPGAVTTKPGSATRAFPGIQAEVLTPDGETVETGGGLLAIRDPWPSMLRGIWGDRERFVSTYWSKWPHTYFPGDGAKRDDDGYFWILGRVDDVINTAGHRIGTMEVESALVDHPAVAEAAVVGIEHEIKGIAIAAFVLLREAHEHDEDLEQTLKDHVAQKIGAIAKPEKVLIAVDLPKTRSGKIMRRLLRDVAEGHALGDTTTLADPSVVARLKTEYESIEG